MVLILGSIIIVYVPGYIKENENEKTRNINLDLIETIQVIVYNKHELNERKINTLIEGKEIKYRIDYPYTIEELLIQTEEAFMSNKFIPLEQRISIVNRLDSIKLNIKPSTQIETTKKPDKSTSNISNFLGVLISIILGIIITFLGIWSFLIKLRKEKKQTIDNEIEEEKEVLQEHIMNSLNFHRIIGDILEVNKINFGIADGNLRGIDYVVYLGKEKRLFISTNYLSAGESISIERIRTIRNTYKRYKEGGAVILNNADSKKRNSLNIYLRKLEVKVKIIISSDVEEIETELIRYINSFR